MNDGDLHVTACLVDVDGCCVGPAVARVFGFLLPPVVLVAAFSTFSNSESARLGVKGVVSALLCVVALSWLFGPRFWAIYTGTEKMYTSSSTSRPRWSLYEIAHSAGVLYRQRKSTNSPQDSQVSELKHRIRYLEAKLKHNGAVKVRVSLFELPQSDALIDLFFALCSQGASSAGRSGWRGYRGRPESSSTDSFGMMQLQLFLSQCSRLLSFFRWLTADCHIKQGYVAEPEHSHSQPGSGFKCSST